MARNTRSRRDRPSRPRSPPAASPRPRAGCGARRGRSRPALALAHRDHGAPRTRRAAALWLLLPIAAFAVGVVAIPELRWSRWRYEVRDEEIDLRHGTVTITRTLIPMLRVQHVDTTRGPLDQLLGLATVVVHTAAGRTTIPALDDEYAGRLRDQIATLARTADEL